MAAKSGVTLANNACIDKQGIIQNLVRDKARLEGKVVDTRALTPLNVGVTDQNKAVAGLNKDIAKLDSQIATATQELSRLNQALAIAEKELEVATNNYNSKVAMNASK